MAFFVRFRGLLFVWQAGNHYLEVNAQFSLIYGSYYRGNWAIGRFTENSTRLAGGSVQGLEPIDPALLAGYAQRRENYVIDQMTAESIWATWATIRGGYRYQRSQGGFLFRAGMSLANRASSSTSFDRSEQVTYWSVIPSQYSSPVAFWLLNLDLSLGWSF